jgi:hypothetical protein
MQGMDSSSTPKESIWWLKATRNRVVASRWPCQVEHATLKAKQLNDSSVTNSIDCVSYYKYGYESHGTWTREWQCWWGPAAIVNDPSSHQRGCPTSTNPLLSASNKNLVLGPGWGLDTMAIGHNIILTLLQLVNELEDCCSSVIVSCYH